MRINGGFMDKTEINGNEKSKKHVVFVTLYSFDGGHYFGIILNEDMHLNPAGEMAAKWAVILADEYGVKLDSFVVMPNHMHMLLEIDGMMLDDMRFGRKLEQMMEWFMTLTTREYHTGENRHKLIPAGVELWKHDFSFHILKTDTEIRNARKYIRNNPCRWHLDVENTESVSEHADYYGVMLGDSGG
jgi:putative transposase